MRYLRASLLVIAASCLAVGCTTFQASGLACVPEGPVKGAIEAAIKEKDGTGAVNITIIHQASIVDVILS